MTLITTLTIKQQEALDRYLESTKDNPEKRISTELFIAMGRRIKKYRPDREMLPICEMKYLKGKQEEDRGETNFIQVEEYVIKKPTGAGRHSRLLKNTVVNKFLNREHNYNEMSSSVFWLDDIFTGVAALDLGGNTRCLSKYMLFDILKGLELVNTEILQDYCGVAIRQAQKIMVAVVICHSMILKEIKRISL